MPASVVGLGRLEQLEILDPATHRTHTLRLTGRWLVWHPGRKAFYLTRGRIAAAQARIPAPIARAHQRFHRAAPASVQAVQVAARPHGRAVQLGLVKSLVYVVPRQVRSPGKNQYRWHHAFGDTGHQGGSDYPLRVMPALVKDSRGDLFIKRRPGNIFTVDTWLRG